MLLKCVTSRDFAIGSVNIQLIFQINLIWMSVISRSYKSPTRSIFSRNVCTSNWIMKETHSDESNHSSLCDTRSKRSKKEKCMILGSLSVQQCIFSLQDRLSVHFIFSGFQQQLICAGSHFGQDRFTLWEHNPLFYHSIKNQYQKHYQYHHISVLIHYIVNNV